MASKFATIADFLTIYIEEAHPNRGNQIVTKKITTHRTLKDRLVAAQILSEFLDSTPCSLAVDSMSDDANRAYGGLFERLCVVQDGRVAYLGQRGPMGYKLEEVQHWLEIYAATTIK